MIYDSLGKIDLYFSADVHKRIYRALKFAIDFDVSADVGRYAIEGDAVYAIVATYQSKAADELRFEAHKKYIDIQIVLEGREILGVADKNNLRVEEVYSENKDVEFLAQPVTYTALLLESGLFAVLYPHEAHQPGIKVDEPCNVKKMVIKVKV